MSWKISLSDYSIVRDDYIFYIMDFGGGVKNDNAKIGKSLAS